MKKLQYSLSLSLDLISPENGEIIDCHTETEYFDTWEQAKKAADKYSIGDVVGGYGDGVKCVVALIEVSEEPQEIDFFD